ncbi:MAG: hypothetical protein WDN06_06700 [Asticcacaulis sp.]
MQRQAFASPLGLREAGATPLGLMAGEDDIGVVSIPRIAIHFFPDNETSLQSCDTAALDRRMSRAQCVVKRGGIAEAIETYRHEPTPSLVFVESTARGRDLLDSSANWPRSATPTPRSSSSAPITTFRSNRELIRQGVSDYMVRPGPAAATDQGHLDPVQRPGNAVCRPRHRLRRARGGAGSSSIAHNFAYSLSEQMSANTVIVDFDLPFGTAGLDFNQDPPQGMADALNEPDRLDSVLLDRMLTKCSDKLSLFSSPAALDQDYTADDESYAEVTRKVRSAAPLHRHGPAARLDAVAEGQPDRRRRRGDRGHARSRKPAQRQEHHRPAQACPPERPGAAPGPQPGRHARPPRNPVQGLHRRAWHRTVLPDPVRRQAVRPGVQQRPEWSPRPPPPPRSPTRSAN